MWKNRLIIGFHFSTKNCQGTFQISLHKNSQVFSFSFPLKAAGKFCSAVSMVLEGPLDPENKIKI